MKYFTLIITIAILSSCGIYNSKIAHLRYVKVDNQDVAILEKSSNKEIKENTQKNTEEISENAAILEANQTNLVIQNVQFPSVEKEQISRVQHQSNNTTNDKKSDEEDDVVNQAYRAEKDANIAMGFSIAATLFGIIPFIIGLIFYKKAKSSRYITPTGESRLKVSKVFLIVETIIYGIEIIFVSLLILLLL